MAEQFHITGRHHFARRAATLAASAAITSVIAAALLGVFHSSSKMPWLTPTSSNAVLLSSCDKATSTVSRRACVEQIVARVQSRDGSVRLAANPVGPAR